MQSKSSSNYHKCHPWFAQNYFLETRRNYVTYLDSITLFSCYILQHCLDVKMFSKPNNQWSNRQGFNFKRHTPTMTQMTKMNILITSVIIDSLRLKSQIGRQQHQQCFVINSEIWSYMWIYSKSVEDDRTPVL